MKRSFAGYVQKNRAASGFTLIETCIVLAIASIALASTVDLIKQYRAHQVLKINNERITTIKKALVGYVAKNNRLPCAAPRDLPSANPNYGKGLADCTLAAAGTVRTPGARVLVPPQTVRIGAVPIRDLGLSNAYMGDAWGNQFTYAVTEGMTVSPLNADIGAIDVLDPSGVSDVTPPASAFYAISSPGRDGKGAWSTEGKIIAACGVTVGNDNENCDDDASFTSAPFSIVQGAEHFDDRIIYTNVVNKLALPTCAPGEILTSTDTNTFACVSLAQPPICSGGQRLTSTDGVTFICQTVPQPPVCTTPTAVLTSTDGLTFSCPPLPPPPVPPPGIVLPPACPVDQVLTSNGTTIYCKTPVLVSTQVSCAATGWAWGTARTCTATCPAGYRVTGGGLDAQDVRSTKGHLVMKDGNGFACYVNIDSCDSGAAQPCGMRCVATCSKIQ